MIARLYSAAIVGVDGVEVQIEVDAQPGFKSTSIVGLPDAAVKESAQRVSSAITNSGFKPWEQTYIVNLAPADLRKQGPSFDLPIALGMIAAADSPVSGEDWFIAGELSLDGRLRPVKGMLSLALEARVRGRKKLLIPRGNEEEAAILGGLEVYPVATLRQAWEALNGQTASQCAAAPDALPAETRDNEVDFDEIKGQPFARRALEITAAGGHNILLCGSPGAGKSMFAQRLPTILPGMEEQEAIEASKIHSVCGLLAKGSGLLKQRPFRAPHHTISDAGLMGGGSTIMPGEITLAHNGVLFLDELPEFNRRTLETLRQPLEAGQVTISRASGSITFPCRFMLMAAMNPCPCGYLGDPRRGCRCQPGQIAQYRRRISGPLLDRFDLILEVPPVDPRTLASGKTGESSQDIRNRVMAARHIQKQRFQKEPFPVQNANMTSRLIRKFCALDTNSRTLLDQAVQDMGLSARAHDRILKVARTIADLAAEEHINSNHLCEAIQLRLYENFLR